MTTHVQRSDFGRYAADVDDFGGELTLPVGADHEIHPAAEAGRWVVVNHRLGQVASTHDEIDDAVDAARRLESDE